ncbi:oleosin 1 [Cucumis sativus]|uniref:Oleosin-like protein n=1 Tax=Cucumis sativus TaxID=3659 RepID=A0A0A0KRH1_CUCSA|nr:oleosin 1 [Cucumis sativus]KGN50321.1 hypothetical protein Csa_000425 [Cucumis sativus]
MKRKIIRRRKPHKKSSCPKTKPFQMHAIRSLQTPAYPFPIYIIIKTTFIQIKKKPTTRNSMAESRNPQYSKSQQFSSGNPQYSKFQQFSSDQLPRSHKVVKAATAVTTGTSFLVLSALIMAGTVIGLAVVTPLFVIFSPVLVPALITATLLILGFLASGGFGAAAIVVLLWFFRYMGNNGRNRSGDWPEKSRFKFNGKGRVEG